MFQSRVFDVGRYTYVTLFDKEQVSKKIPMRSMEEMEEIEDIYDFGSSPKWNNDMSWREEQTLLFNSVPMDEWVDTNYVKKDTGVPFKRVSISSKLKNIRGIIRRQHRGHVEFKRVALDDIL